MLGGGVSSAMDLRGKKLERFGEPAKFLPVAFVGALVVMLYSIYMHFHAWPKFVQLGENSSRWYVAVFNSLTAMLLTCYLRCILVSPGNVPDQVMDPSWTLQPPRRSTATAEAGAEGGSGSLSSMQEAKRSGDRRSCKWCAKYKPDRCHHCRVCRTCVLKMDHHCPWIYNCVGFGNQKFFFLLLVYSCAACLFVTGTMLESLRAVHSGTQFTTMFAILFGETLSAMLSFCSSLFLLFHIWLMLRGMTTIEFCEKAMRRTGYDSSAYNRGGWANVRVCLGENPLLWLLPVATPAGTGLEFVSEESPILGVKGSVGGNAFPQPPRKGGGGGTGSAPSSDAEEPNSKCADGRLPGPPAEAALMER